MSVNLSGTEACPAVVPFGAGAVFVLPDDVLAHPVRADAPMHMASPNAMNFLILFLLAILSFIQLSIAAMYLILYIIMYPAVSQVRISQFQSAVFRLSIIRRFREMNMSSSRFLSSASSGTRTWVFTSPFSMTTILCPRSSASSML